MTTTNPNARLEAFCDGVFAIAITLLIIDIKLPPIPHHATTHDLLLALWRIGPSILVFLLSFIVIFITWVNHHQALKLVQGTSTRFIYANGLLLLSVVFIPFPTSLLGEFILTDHAGPAVSLYCAVCGLQAVSWMLMSHAALAPSRPLVTEAGAVRAGNANRIRSYYATAMYTSFAVAAFWWPLTIAIIVAGTWVVWLLVGVGLKEEEKAPAGADR